MANLVTRQLLQPIRRDSECLLRHTNTSARQRVVPSPRCRISLTGGLSSERLSAKRRCDRAR